MPFLAFSCSYLANCALASATILLHTVSISSDIVNSFRHFDFIVSCKIRASADSSRLAMSELPAANRQSLRTVGREFSWLNQFRSECREEVFRITRVALLGFFGIASRFLHQVIGINPGLA